MANHETATLWVLSDLHLTAAGEQCVFRTHAELASLLRHIAAHPGPAQVLLNGDVFDFLQLPGYDGISLPLAAQRMGAILDSLEAEPAGRNIVQALREVTDAGHALHCLPGNHDPELALSEVQKMLARRVGAAVSLLPTEGCWRIEVAGRAVVGLHGHHGDAFNAIPVARMLQAQARGDTTVPMPPGSRLVCEVINPYRRAKDAAGVPRFPFVDAVPSDLAAALALIILDPQLATGRLADTPRIAAQVLVRAVSRQLGLSDARLSAATDASGTPADPVLAALGHAIGNAMTAEERAAAERVEGELLGYLRDGPPRAAPGHRLASASGGWARNLLLRALGRLLDASRGALDPATPDKLAQETMISWGRDVVAVTGHTHAAKYIRHGAQGVYINTGGWIGLAPLPPTTDIAAVSGWLDRLQRGEAPSWQGCPVARIDASGAALLHWNGSALVDWSLALPGAGLTSGANQP